MNSKITLEQRKRSCYRNTECALHDAVYLIKNEYQELIGHMFLDETEDGWRIEWLELLSIFQQHVYLRSILQELQSLYPNKKITLECSENAIIFQIFYSTQKMLGLLNEKNVVFACNSVTDKLHAYGELRNMLRDTVYIYVNGTHFILRQPISLPFLLIMVL